MTHLNPELLGSARASAGEKLKPAEASGTDSAATCKQHVEYLSFTATPSLNGESGTLERGLNLSKTNTIRQSHLLLVS